MAQSTSENALTFAYCHDNWPLTVNTISAHSQLCSPDKWLDCHFKSHRCAQPYQEVSSKRPHEWNSWVAILNESHTIVAKESDNTMFLPKCNWILIGTNWSPVYQRLWGTHAYYENCLDKHCCQSDNDIHSWSGQGYDVPYIHHGCNYIFELCVLEEATH